MLWMSTKISCQQGLTFCGHEMNQQKIDAAWAMEAESRIDAFERGELKAIPAHEVFQKYGLIFMDDYLSDEEADH